MLRLPFSGKDTAGIHKRVIKAFEKYGFKIVRQGMHISMYDGRNIIIIPRANPINTFTLKGIIQDSGVALDDFLKALHSTSETQNVFATDLCNQKLLSLKYCVT